MKKTYTETIHAARLMKILERKNPCDLCPAAPHYNADHDVDHAGFYWKNSPCIICERFVGYFKNDCPCHKYGQKEAIKRTWLSLEAKGYLE